MDNLKIRRVLISVSDKSGLLEFAHALTKWNVEIISTGGTLRALQEGGVAAMAVSEVTGFPEILDGRVKTLHPKIHAGLLALADNPAHAHQLAELDIIPIDMVVVNLYPFEEAVAKNGISISEALEQIDIGGPTMLRAAAKNYKFKVVVFNPSHYNRIIRDMEKQDGGVSEELRIDLAAEAFHRIAQYDLAIASYLASHLMKQKEAELFPERFSITFSKDANLRYGENPHQRGALYGEFSSYFRVLHGKELSYNNILDIQAAAELAEEFSEPTAVIVKHTNPCGVGSGTTLTDAYRKAFATDTKSPFGGIVCVNRPLDEEAARTINEIFTEVIIAPEYAPGVFEFLSKKKDRRLVQQKRPVADGKNIDLRSVAGGILVQTGDRVSVGRDQLRTVTDRVPTEEEFQSMLFGWRVARHVKSNAIVYARPDRTMAIGAGQMSRVDSTRIATSKAREEKIDLAGTAVASDGFFPFADGLLEVVAAGATAVIQPGGSVRDEEVIRAANEKNVAMVFTGIRHFRHA